MTSFRSKNYPKSGKGLKVLQEYAMYYYAVFMLVVMIGVMVKVSSGSPILLFGLIGTAIALIMGNVVAYVQLKKKIAQIFFLNEHFSVMSTYEVLFDQKNQVFPRLYANPQRISKDIISIHFHDQVIQLYRADWEDFDLVWEWLTSMPTATH